MFEFPGKEYGPLLVAAVMLVLLFGVASGPVKDFDTFWQLQSGKYMVETGQVIRLDTFSLAADEPRHEHCWLHDIIFYGAWRVGGYDGIALLRGLIIAATGTVLLLAARARGSSYLSILLVLPFALAQTHSFWVDRPQLWTMLCLSLFLLVLELYRQGRLKAAPAFFLVPLTVVWANLHAGVLLALAVMLAYAVGALVNERTLSTVPASKMPRQLCWMGLFVALAMLVTPYSVQIIKSVAGVLTIREARQVTAINADWQPLTFAAFPIFYYIYGLFLALVAMRFRRLDATDIFLLSGLFVSGLYLERNTPFFMFAWAVVLPAYLDDAGSRFTEKVSFRKIFSVGILLLGIGYAFLMFRDLSGTYGFFARGFRAERFPVKSAEFILREKLPGNLFNSYVSGGYLMWALFPQHLVFWDQRQNSVEMDRAANAVVTGLDISRAVLDRYRVNMILTEPLSFIDGKRWPLTNVLDPNVWAPVYAETSYLLYVRITAVDPQWLARRRLPAYAVDSAMLSAATMLVQERPQKPHAYWEAARVFLARGQIMEARGAMDNYFAVVQKPEWSKEAAAAYQRMGGSLP